MASEVEICNLALQRLGQQANLIGLSENSVYAETAKSSLPIVRDSLLERHAWNFATTRVRMPKMKERPIGWAASYKVPSDCVRVLTVYEERPKDFWEGKTWVVEMQGDDRVVCTNMKEPILKYVRKVKNAELFSPMFADALAWHLAAALAGPIVKGDTGMTVGVKLIEQARYYELAAITADVGQRRTKQDRPDAPWVSGRGV